MSVDPDPAWPVSGGEQSVGVGPVWPPRDRTGMIHPRRFTALTMLRALPSIIGAFTTIVPDQFCSKDEQGDDGGIVVACPCGAEPCVPLARTIECDCGRFFLGMGDQVRVFNPGAQDSRPES